MTVELAASAETAHVGLPFLERVRRIADRGLRVGIWDWSNHPDDLDELAATNAEVVFITGYPWGNFTNDDAIPELLVTAEEPLRVAEKLRRPRLNLHGTGLDDRGLPVWPVETATGVMWARATATLQWAAALGECEGRVFTLENLNLAVDYPDTPFIRAEDTPVLASVVDSPGLRMNLDLYHAQIGERNLIELCRGALPWVGETQVVDVPGRCEPGTEEINYPAVTVALWEMGYDGIIALKTFIRNGPDLITDAFIRAFTPEVE